MSISNWKTDSKKNPKTFCRDFGTNNSQKKLTSYNHIASLTPTPLVCKFFSDKLI